MSNIAASLRLEPAGRVSPVRGRRGASVTTSLHISLINSANRFLMELCLITTTLTGNANKSKSKNL